MQNVPNRFDFLVVESDEADELIQLGHRLMNEKVKAPRGEVLVTVPLLLNFLHEQTQPAPWCFKFDFSADAIRVLRESEDPRFQDVLYLVARASRPLNTRH